MANPILTPARIVARKRGCSDAEGQRDALIEANYRLVPFVVKRYFSHLVHEEWDDALSAGYLGLAEASERWNPVVGAKFSTYACRVIWCHVARHLRNVRRQGFSGLAQAELPADTLLPLDTLLLLSIPKNSRNSCATDHKPLIDRNAETENEAMRRLERQEVWQRVDTILPPAQAAILRLHYREEITIINIARLQRCSRQNITRLHRKALDAARLHFYS